MIDRSRTGGLTYVDSGLIRKLTVYAGAPGELRWQVDVGDEELGRPDSAACWTRYRIDDNLVGGSDGKHSRNWTNYPWPVSGGGLDPALIEDVRRFAPIMLWFLRDRHDLGLILLAGDEAPTSSLMVRDGVEATRWSGGAAGLVQAMILARSASDPQLEALAVAKLDRMREQEVHGFGGSFAEAVGHWAEREVAWSPVDISDLVALGRKKGRSRNR
ncbi:hypothetical protein [Plantactinospora sp. KLBMP9567]|uniref:hypothetical protein n=1 Tax=Plantactinospora sp. KLBMP9567 TaxID=3085900 RepID=UPI002982A13E|nr:hypothetical protein [Plantactinospora sp. KLBMP9567]MDW5326934.1 hypothetical protein [Plantactinospora sp. KLBMP9567]